MIPISLPLSPTEPPNQPVSFIYSFFPSLPKNPYILLPFPPFPLSPSLLTFFTSFTPPPSPKKREIRWEERISLRWPRIHHLPCFEEKTSALLGLSRSAPPLYATPKTYSPPGVFSIYSCSFITSHTRWSFFFTPNPLSNPPLHPPLGGKEKRK